MLMIDLGVHYPQVLRTLTAIESSGFRIVIFSGGRKARNKEAS